ncbi:DUF6049 family protein [Allosalinactinospora lopnorensis]|uniref:DUF6049 family protein n=1 Tax=Allosalinactinospora lopnorensis TaxID=1352348 RepID=UPI0009E1A4C0|nr:DUF6049 family protein [Allosalinactinospora lopnorensis]
MTTVVTTAVFLAPALTVFLPVQAAGVSSPANASSDDEPVIVEEITPRAVDEDSTLTVTGRVTNTTDDVIEDVTVRLRYSPYAVSDRSELDGYAEGAEAQPPKTGQSVGLDDPLHPGDAVGFELEADAEDLDLDGFGVYPMAIDAVDGSGDGLGIQYTFLPYQGDGKGSDPVDIAWVWPLMNHPQRADDDTYLGEDLTNELRPEGRLNRLLAVGAQNGEVALEPPELPSSPQNGTGDEDARQADDADAGDRVPLTWAVDPGLLSDIERLTTDSYHVLEDPLAVPAESQPTAKTYEPNPDAAAWLEQARTIIGDQPVISTPYASPDIAALLRNDLESDAEAAMFLGDEVVQRVLERPADPEVALPPDGVMNEDTQDFFTEHGAERFLLRDAAMPGQDWVGHTPTAQVELPNGDDGSATALVADSRLTRVLGKAGRGPGDAALAQQRFAAETALISAEQAGADRTIVASPPSGWDPAPELAQDVLQSSEDLPWLEPVAFEDVEAASDAEPERHGLTYTGAAAEDELSSPYLEQVKEVRREVRLFNSILTEDSDPFRPAILRLESAAWRDKEALGNQTRSLLDQSVTDTRGKVRIIESEPVTLASKTGTIGVLVANDLEDEPVSVHLSMFSSNSERLSIGEYQDSMEIGPGGKTTVYVPLTARVNGRTVLHMSLHNADGEPVSVEETPIPVNATGMGAQALIISASGALVLVIVLAPRALRRWARTRTSAEGASQSEADPPSGTGGHDSTPDAMQDNDSGPSGDQPDDSGAAPEDPAAGENQEREH